MAEDWLADVRKYAPAADEDVVGSIVRYLGIALRNRDSSLVAFSDPEEVGRVREGFLRKKLALTEPDSVLNEALDWVKGLMSGDRTKNRVTVYYLLAHYFGKLDLFGGSAGTSAASLGAGGAAAGVATLASLAPADAARPAVVDTSPRSAPVASERPSQDMSRNPAQSAYAADLDHDGAASSGWPRWLTWLLIALALVLLFLLLRSCMAETTTPTAQTSANEAASAPVSGTAVNESANTQVADGGATSAVPAGAGVVSGVKDDKPLLTVYFASGKSAVSNDLASATDTLKAYLSSHPGSKLGVSGYNDPSGNAALNAELSKKRAQGVAAALAAAGIPKASIELVKPAETTTASVTPEQARRVEVTVQ